MKWAEAFRDSVFLLVIGGLMALTLTQCTKCMNDNAERRAKCLDSGKPVDDCRKLFPNS